MVMYSATLILLLSLIQINLANLLAFNCGDSSVNRTTVSLVHVPLCSNKPKNVTTEQVEVIVTQSDPDQGIDYLRCRIIARHSVFYCGVMSDSKQEDGDYTEIINADRTECKTLVKQRKYRPAGVGLLIEGISNVHFTSYVSFGSMQGEKCTPGGKLQANGRSWERAVRMTSLEIDYHTGSGSANLEEDSIDLGGGDICKYSGQSCFKYDRGFIFWKTTKPDCSDEVPKSVVFKGFGQLITDVSQDVQKVLQVTHDGYDFQILLRNHTTHVCGFPSFHTEHPGLFVTLVRDNSALFALKKKILPSKNMLTYVNSKIVYSLRHTKLQVKKLYDLFELKRCELQHDFTKNLLTLARISPEDFAFQYFYTAVVLGEVIHIFKCDPVMVNPLPLSDICFNELPVEYKNMTMYMTPRSRILTSVGREIACDPFIKPMYFIGGNWYSQEKHGLRKNFPPP